MVRSDGIGANSVGVRKDGSSGFGSDRSDRNPKLHVGVACVGEALLPAITARGPRAKRRQGWGMYFPVTRTPFDKQEVLCLFDGSGF